MTTFWLGFLGLAAAWVPLDQPVQAHKHDATRSTDSVTQEMKLRGRILRMQAPDQLVVRTSGGANGDKDLTLTTSAQTRITINGKAAQFSDLRIGMDVNSEVVVRDGRTLATLIAVGGAPLRDATGAVGLGPTASYPARR